MDVEVVIGSSLEVGEAPHWDERSQTLWLVDLTAGTVLRSGLGAGEEPRSFPVGQEVGAVVPRRDRGLVLAVRDGIMVATEEGADLELRLPIEFQAPSNRMNDAKCDPVGRLFAGTMAFDVSPGRGALYRIDPDWNCTAVVSELTQSNGLGWSPDGSSMYLIDSATRGVDAFDYDVETGEVGRRRRLVTIDAADGIPDGMTVDADGNLWVACFGGSRVRCYSPTGDHLTSIGFPVSQVTSCAFGGQDLADLYVTSACYRMGADQRRREPLAGATFACRPGVTGLAPSAFAG